MQKIDNLIDQQMWEKRWLFDQGMWRNWRSNWSKEANKLMMELTYGCKETDNKIDQTMQRYWRSNWSKEAKELPT